jgi:hypothetical protein
MAHPISHVKSPEISSFCITYDLILLCIFNITFKTFLQTLFFTSFCHNPNLQTVSNAFLKSINVQYDFSQTTYIYIYISISTCKQNILSVVEYPFLNPAWAFGILSIKSAYFVSLLLRIDVKTLPTEETNVIPQ